mgnify:FL=1
MTTAMATMRATSAAMTTRRHDDDDDDGNVPDEDYNQDEVDDDNTLNGLQSRLCSNKFQGFGPNTKVNIVFGKITKTTKSNIFLFPNLKIRSENP